MDMSKVSEDKTRQKTLTYYIICADESMCTWIAALFRRKDSKLTWRSAERRWSFRWWDSSVGRMIEVTDLFSLCSQDTSRHSWKAVENLKQSYNRENASHEFKNLCKTSVNVNSRGRPNRINPYRDHHWRCGPRNLWISRTYNWKSVVIIRRKFGSKSWTDLQKKAITSDISNAIWFEIDARLALASPRRFPIRTEAATLRENGAWKVVDADTERMDCAARLTGPRLEGYVYCDSKRLWEY